jgi:hypothetical protein
MYADEDVDDADDDDDAGEVDSRALGVRRGMDAAPRPDISALYAVIEQHDPLRSPGAASDLLSAFAHGATHPAERKVDIAGLVALWAAVERHLITLKLEGTDQLLSHQWWKYIWAALIGAALSDSASILLHSMLFANEIRRWQQFRFLTGVGAQQLINALDRAVQDRTGAPAAPTAPATPATTPRSSTRAGPSLTLSLSLRALILVLSDSCCFCLFVRFCCSERSDVPSFGLRAPAHSP